MLKGKFTLRFAFAFLVLSTFAALIYSRRVSATQAGPTLLKRTVIVSTRRFLRYWPNPSAAEPRYNTWSWTPQITFQILGPVPGGSQWMFEASTPDGKQIASTKEQSGSVGYDVASFPNTHEGNTRWERWTFGWGRVRGWNSDTSSANITTEIFFLNKNPGEYEVKVLRDGELARSAKFTVGADARLVDNGIAQKNNLGGFSMVLPVKVIGAGDGQWDTNAWKTDAFYGSPLSGFIAP